jgi:hypothetical protein
VVRRDPPRRADRRLNARIVLGHIDIGRRDLWASRLDEAEASPPSVFSAKNGWVVAARQAAWSAIVTTPVAVQDPASGVFRVDHLRRALEAAVRGGGDTDTVAAIAGALLGATYGASAVPAQWRAVLHGWPGLTARGLIRLADAILRKGGADKFGHTYDGYAEARPHVRHPYDDKVWIGGFAALSKLPADVDAVVSLCGVGDSQIPAGVEHLDVRLIDRVGENENLDFVLLDTVREVERLRAQGRTVFFHCVQAASRTPTVAALYGARRRGVDIDRALSDVVAVLPGADPNPDFRAALKRVHPTPGGQL